MEERRAINRLEGVKDVTALQYNGEYHGEYHG